MKYLESLTPRELQRFKKVYYWSHFGELVYDLHLLNAHTKVNTKFFTGVR